MGRLQSLYFIGLIVVVGMLGRVAVQMQIPGNYQIACALKMEAYTATPVVSTSPLVQACHESEVEQVPIWQAIANHFGDGGFGWWVWLLPLAAAALVLRMDDSLRVWFAGWLLAGIAAFLMIAPLMQLNSAISKAIPLP